MSEPKTEVKKKYKILLSPRLREERIPVGLQYTSSVLGDLLRRDLGQSSTSLTLTKTEHGEYIRGLVDARVMHANGLAVMLDKADSVIVTLEEITEAP